MKRFLALVLTVLVLSGVVFAAGAQEQAVSAAKVDWLPATQRILAKEYQLPPGALEAIKAEGTKKLIIYNWGDLEFDPATELNGKRFTELTGVEVEWVGTPDEQMMPKLQPLFMAKSGEVDIVPLDATNYRTFADNGWLLDVSDMWDEETLKLYQAGLGGVAIDGKHFSTPQVARVTDMMYYRPSMLKAAGYTAPPTTLDELIEMSVKLTKDVDGNGSIDQWGHAFRASGVLDGAEVIKSIALLYGVNPDRYNGKVNYNNPETVKAVQHLVDLRNKYKVVPPGVTSYQHGEVADMFLSGNVAIVIDPTYLYGRAIESNIKDDFAVAVPPAATKGGKVTVIQNWNGWAVSSFSKNKTAAKVFLDLYRSYQAQVNEFVLENNEVMLLAAYNDPKAKELGYAAVLANMPNTVVDVYQGQGEVYKNVIAEFQNALIGKKTAQQAMDDAQKQIDKIMGY